MLQFAVLSLLALAASGAPVVPPAAWRVERPATAADQTRIIFAVRQENTAFLEQTLSEVSDPDSPRYGQYIPLDKLATLVHGNDESFAAVKEMLAGVESSECQTTMDRGWFDCTLSAADASLLFDAEFHVYRHGITGATVVKTLSRSVPAAVRGHVDFVTGHNTFPTAARVAPAKNLNSTGNLGVTPTSINTAYNLDQYTSKSKGNSQAVASFLKQYFDPADLKKFQSQFGLPDLPIAKVVGVNKEHEEGIEAALDVQYIGATGRGVSTWFVSTSQTANQGQEDFVSWVLQQLNTTDSPWVHSVSYGDVEASIDDSYRVRLNVELQKFGVSGRTVLVAAGDSGVSCHLGQFWPDWPTSSPYVTSVGGTDGPVRAWSGGGGGFSNHYPMPAYQEAAVNKYLNSPVAPASHYFNASGRAYPDVAAFATNFEIVVGGGTTGVAGTSCATPTFAGVISILNDVRLLAGKPTLGFVNPLLYKIGAETPKAFNDITEGSNPAGLCPGFKATTGWDPATGWGSPDFSVLKTLV